MLAYRNEGPYTETAGEALEEARLVKMSAGVAVYTDAGEEPEGITSASAALGARVTIYPLKGNIERVTASKAISSGAAIYPTTDGKVSDAAVGKQIGIAKQAATADGGKIAAVMWGPRGGNDMFSAKAAATYEFLEHFITGVTEDGHKFSETADKGDWLKSSTDGDTDGSDVCQVADDGPGGILQLTCNDKDADNENLQLNGESFKLATGKKLYFETSVALLDVDKCDFFIGLAISDVDILGGVTDRIGFQVDHDGNINCLIEQGSTEYKQDSGVDIADCAAIANFSTTKKCLTFLWDGVDTVQFFVDGVLKKTFTDNGTTIVVPDDEAMSPAQQIKTHTGAGAVQTSFVDYIHIIGEV
ncbi:MAG: hypothetical protein ACYSSI_04975 [Planctomycetota bacterium]|jgi:hypothetical protein